VVDVVEAFDQEIIGLIDVFVQAGARVKKPPRDFTFFRYVFSVNR
jgi:hypothetical protein